MVAAHPPDPGTTPRPWLAEYPPGVPPTYRLPDVALPRLLDDAARDFPELDALVTAHTSVDYATFQRRVATVASVLTGAGVAAGDRVLIALPVDTTSPVVLFAVWQLGAVAVPVDPELPDERLGATVADAAPAAVVATGAVLARLTGAGGQMVRVEVDGSEWPAERRWPSPALGRRLRRAAARPDAAQIRLADAVTSTTDTQAAVAPTATGPADPATAAAILYEREGVEAVGALLTHANLVAAAFQARLWVPDVQAGRERVLVAERLDVPGALTVGLLAAVLSAATLVLADEPDGGDLARAIDRHRPTLCVATADRLSQLADGDSRRRDLSSLRVVLAHAGELDAATAATLERRTAGARVRRCFGVAGAAPLTHAQPVYGRVDVGSIGLPVTGTLAAVVDPDHLDVCMAAGQPGLLLVAGPQVALGLWRRADTTASRVVDGWLVTDRFASMDAGGGFVLLGPREDVVDHGGRLMSVRRVEVALEQHPAVRSAGVTVAADGRLIAAVVTRRMARPGGDELLDHCRGLLDPAAVPDRVVVVPTLPRTPTGGLARDELSQELTRRLA